MSDVLDNVYYHVTNTGAFKDASSQWNPRLHGDEFHMGCEFAWALEALGERESAPTGVPCARRAYAKSISAASLNSLFSSIKACQDSGKWIKNASLWRDCVIDYIGHTPKDWFPNSIYTSSDGEGGTTGVYMPNVIAGNPFCHDALRKDCILRLKTLSTFIPSFTFAGVLDSDRTTEEIVNLDHYISEGSYGNIYTHSINLWARPAGISTGGVWESRYEIKNTIKSNPSDSSNVIFAADYADTTSNAIFLVLHVQCRTRDWSKTPDLYDAPWPISTANDKYIIYNAGNVSTERFNPGILASRISDILQIAGIDDTISFPSFSSSDWNRYCNYTTVWHRANDEFVKIDLVDAFGHFKHRFHANLSSWF